MYYRSIYYAAKHQAVEQVAAVMRKTLVEIIRTPTKRGIKQNRAALRGPLIILFDKALQMNDIKRQMFFGESFNGRHCRLYLKNHASIFKGTVAIVGGS